MHKILFLILSAALILTSCNFRQTQHLSENNKPIVRFKTQLIDKSSNISYYLSEDFLAFETEPDTRNINDLYPLKFRINKEAFTNIHNSAIIDTLYTYTLDDNIIIIYKSADKDLLSLFDVTDSRLGIIGNISTGISKDQFSIIFNIEPLTNDTIEIGNLDRTDFTRFYFTNDKLVRIRVEPYID